jgi:filamentous hemagglutinin family protein
MSISVPVVLLCLCAPASLLAQIASTTLPTGGSVASGTATITASTNTTNINQSSNSAVINWQSFSIGSSATVNFYQPGTTSVTLNRVTGNAGSVIDGVLSANGNVFLINPSGILVDKTASISTGGFVGSTLDISDSDFQAGNYTFTSSGSKAGSVINLGTISTNQNGGYVALMGNSVSNQGVITATKGTVALAAGDQITLNFNGNSLVGVTIGAGALNALVENKQAIYANGGTVILTAKAADDLLSAQVNNSGLIQAQTIGDLKGSITLNADGGTTSVSGTLDASAPNGGDGGQIVTSGTTVTVADGTTVTTQSALGSGGLWTIDSYGFTVAASGGNMTATELGSALDTTSVDIASATASSNGVDSSVNINAPVSWTGNTALTLAAADYVNVNGAITATGANAALALNAGKDSNINASITLSGANAGLTLSAGGDINVNAPVTLSGSNATLAMTYGGDYNILTPASYAGAVLDSAGIPVANKDTSGGTYGSITLGGNNASLNINGNSYTLIHSLNDLDSVSGSGYYALAGNLNAGGTTYTGAPIGSFSGTLAGLGNTISNLTIAAGSQNNVGLIGSATNATLRDIGLANVNITSGGEYVGALLGTGRATTIKGDYSTGQVTGYSIVGGLAGSLSSGTTAYSYSSANVTSTETVSSALSNTSYPNFFTGGLIGYDGGSISHSDATGNVTSYNGYTGGLVGFAGSSIDLSYATGNVKETTLDTSDGNSSVGGLVGNSRGNVSNSFATGNVSGYDQVGGLIGLVGFPGTGDGTYSITNSYATGNVSSYGWAGDGVAATSGAGTGGLVGVAYGTDIIDSFATGNVTSYYNQPYTNGGEANGYVGGLVGYLGSGTVTGSYATGNVTVTGSYLYGAGGLIGGDAESTVENSYAYGDVNGNNYVGGLIGFLGNGGSLTDSASYGDVSGLNDVGGVVGYSSGYTTSGNGEVTSTGNTISNVASYGDVTAAGNGAGGIVGFDEYGTVDNAAVYGNVQGATGVGAVVGDGYGVTITNAQSSGQVQSDATQEELSRISTSTGAAAVQSSNIESNNTEDSAEASGSLGDQVQENILVNDPSRYSATVKTVTVDGVEYQVQDNDNSGKDEDKEEHK